MKTVKLGDVLQKTSTMKWKEQPQERIYSYIDLTSVDRSRHEITQTNDINAKNAPSRARKIVKADDILFGTTRPTLNRLCIVPEEYNEQICSTGFCVLRANTELITPSFVYYLLTTNGFVEYVEITQRGTSYPAVTDKDVKLFEFALPSLEEQRRIVARLDAAFEKISRAEVLMRQNLDNVVALQKSILHKYLSASDSTHTHRLGDLCAVLGGKRLPRGEKLLNSLTSHPYVRVADFNGQGGVDMGNIKYITDNVYQNISRYIINKEDVFLSIAGTIGVTGIIPEKLDGANLTENACRLVPSEAIDTRYLYYFTTSDMFRIQALAATKQTAQPKLALMRIKDIRIDLPDVGVQKKVVTKLDDALGKTRELEAQYQKKLSKFADLRQSLLQEAFSTTNTV